MYFYICILYVNVYDFSYISACIYIYILKGDVCYAHVEERKCLFD